MRLKLALALIVIALITATYGAAALTSVSLDRTVAAGTVLADTNANVTVKFEALGTYATAGVMTEDANGKVSFDLSKILTAPASGFNTEATFSIGSATAYVFRVTNNSNIAVKVSLTGATGGLELWDSSGKVVSTGTTIASGGTGNFYYKIISTGVAKTTAISGTLHVGI